MTGGIFLKLSEKFGKAAACVLAAAVLLSQAPALGLGHGFRAFAEDEVGAERVSGVFKYVVLENGEAEITGLADRNVYDIDIPAEIDGHAVVSIGENAFTGIIRSLRLPQGLREIKSRAFDGILECPIEIPETVVAIEERAFGYGMEIMSYIAIPSSLDYDPSNAYPPMPTVLRYHTENGKAVIDSYVLGDGTGYNLFVPETICSFDVKSIGEFTYKENYSRFWERVKAVMCKEGVSLPDIGDKVEVRYIPDGDDGCKITSVVGNDPDLTLKLYNDINGRKITGISGVAAELKAVAVPDGLTDNIDVSFPMISCKYDNFGVTVTGVSLNGAPSLSLSSNDLYVYTVILTEELDEKVSFEGSHNRIIYTETEGGVEINDITFIRDLFIPTVINGKPVLRLTDDCPKDLFRDDSERLYIPASLDSDEVTSTYKIVYTDNSDSVSLTITLRGNHWGSGGRNLEDIFGKPIDTLVVVTSFGFGVNYDLDKNIIRYEKAADGSYVITEIRPGEETSTVTIPETIGGVSVSGFKEGALDDVDCIIVPESLADDIPEDIEKVVYTIDEDGDVIVTEMSENADVKFPESIGGTVVDSVIVSEDAADKVNVPKTADKISYTEEEDGSVTANVVQQGENNEKATVPDEIDGKPVGSVAVKEGIAADVPETADRFTYTENEDGSVTVTDTEPGAGKDSVTVPDKIGGKDVDTVIVEEGADVEIPETSNRITYTEDEDGNITVTDVELGDGKDKATVPPEIGGKKVDTVLVKEGTDVDVPETAAKVTYTEDEDGNITITEIIPAQENGKDLPVKLPDKINGKTPELSEQAKKQLPHEHTGGTATCTEKTVCEFCGEEYGDLAEHNFEDGVCTACKAEDPNANKPDPEDGNNGKDEPEDENKPEDEDSPEDSSTKVVAEDLPENLTMRVSELSDSDEIANYLKRHSEWNLAQCYNIELFENETQVYDLNNRIRLRFKIPESLRANGREFAVLRVHNSNVEILSDIDSNADTVTVLTDKFSTYAIVYKNAVTDDDDDDLPSGDIGSNNYDTDSANTKNPYTGSETPITAGIVLACITGAAVAAIKKRRTK